MNEVYPKSFWAGEASRLTVYGPLSEDIETDVAIIGAGFTGLSSAYHLQKQGVSCALLEAVQPGWGASGRNGGMTVPRYKSTYAELAGKFGVQVAARMFQVAHAAVDLVESIAQEVQVEPIFERAGHIAPGNRTEGAPRFENEVRWLEKEMGDHVSSMLSPSDLEKRIGEPFYTFGYFEPRGGALKPLQFCVDLAKALSDRKVPIYGNSPVQTIRRKGGRFILLANGSRIVAKNVILATNAYTETHGICDELKHGVLPIVSSVIATAPLPQSVLGKVLPGRNVVTDVKRLTNYFRIVDGRLVFGGRGGASNKESASIYQRLKKEMVAIFPALSDVPIEYTWSGRVAVTLDGLPHIGVTSDGCHFALGYNGRGVALATYLGSILARRVAGEQIDCGALSSSEIKRIPFYSLRLPAKQVAIQYFRMLDAMGR